MGTRMTDYAHRSPRWIVLAAGLAIAALATAGNTTSVQHDGQKRSYVVHVPKSYSGVKSVPLLIALHGTDMSGEDMLTYTDLVRKSEESGFILVAPSSMGSAFNDGAARDADVMKVADVAFIEAVADDAKKQFKIDEQRVYLVGFSNGGSMVQRIAVESQYAFAAFASVSGHPWVLADRIPRPRPLLLIFGTSDPLNPVAGGTIYVPFLAEKPAHAATAKGWAERFKCDPTPAIVSVAERVAGQLWRNCEYGSGVVWYEVDGLAHQWAGGKPMPVPEFVVGAFTTAPSIGDLVWNFFSTTP